MILTSKVTSIKTEKEEIKLRLFIDCIKSRISTEKLQSENGRDDKI